MADKLPEYISISVADFIRGEHRGKHVSVSGLPCGVTYGKRGNEDYFWVAMVSGDGVGHMEGVSEGNIVHDYRRAAYLIRAQIRRNLQFPDTREQCTLSGVHRGDILEIDSLYAFIDDVVFRGYIPRG